MSVKMKKKPDVYVARRDELARLPVIHAWSVVRCEESDCPAVHVFLFGKNGCPLAHFPLDEHSMSELMRDVQGVLDGGKMNKELH